jgi:hypothetical protein
LEYARSLDPPCPWGKDVSFDAASNGEIETLLWLRSQDPPCPWDREACWSVFYENSVYYENFEEIALFFEEIK